MKGLCLSGGGIKAAAHIGALKALEEENIKFDCVSGASSGSMIATMYALGYNSNEMLEMLKKYAPKIKYFEWKNILKMILGIIFERQIIIDGLNSGKVIEKIINDICKKHNIQNINQIKMPLLISMVGLQNGIVYIASSKQVRKNFSDKIKYITDMPIRTAVRASCTFPVVMAPCIYDNIQLVDGGVRENLPWKSLKQIGADEVWGIEFDTTFSKNDCCMNLIDVAERFLELQGRELANYEKDGIDKIINIPLKKVGLLDSSKIDSLYKIGYTYAKQQLKNKSFI